MEAFSLGNRTIASGVTQLQSHLGMRTADDTDKCEAAATAHTVCLGGTFVGGTPVLAMARLVVSNGGEWPGLAKTDGRRQLAMACPCMHA